MNTVADGKTESQQMSIAQVFTRYGTVGQLGRRDRWEYLLCQSKYYCSKKQLPWMPPTCVSLKTRSTGIVPAGTAGHWVRSASSPHESDGTVRLSCMSYAIKFNTMQIYIKIPIYKPVGIKNLISFPRIGLFWDQNVKSATDSCPINVLFRHNFVYLRPII